MFALYAFLFFWLLFIYKAGRWLAGPADAVAPLRNADWIIDIESALGLFVEPEIQQLTEASGLEPVTTWLYTAVHQPVYVGFFIMLFFVGQGVFPFVWRWFWTANFMAIPIFWLFPLAPPRLVPELALNDPTHTTLQLGGSTTWLIESDFRNVYAAMPSLHVGYPILFTTVVFCLLAGWRFRWLIWLYPMAMLWAVVASANHYFLDVVGGAAVIVGSAWIVARIWPSLERPWARARSAPLATPGGPLATR
jgi:membrane-associated phospholipid phosphatase